MACCVVLAAVVLCSAQQRGDALGNTYTNRRLVKIVRFQNDPLRVASPEVIALGDF